MDEKQKRMLNEAIAADPYDIGLVIPEPTAEEAATILAELRAMHDWLMPHDTRSPEWDPAGCPPNCPFRKVVEAGAAAIVRGLTERNAP